MEKGGPVRLDGEWEFNWLQLLPPDRFPAAGQPATKTYYTLPSAWNGIEFNGEALGATGFATLRLRILPPLGKSRLTLRLFNVNSACTLWVNGKPSASSGLVATSAEEEIPRPSLLMIDLPAHEQPADLVLQVSNFNHREGGITSSIILGPHEVMLTQHVQTWGMALFIIGILLVMGIYHLVIFSFRRSNISPLYFGLYCLLWMVYYLCSDSSEWVINVFFQNISPTVLDRIALSGFIISVPVGYTFFRSLYQNEFPKIIQRYSVVIAVVYIAINISSPYKALTTALPVYYASSVLLILYCLFKLYRAMRNGREGAAFILAGFLVLGLVGVNDMLYDMGIIHSVFLLPAGMFVFVLFQAFALSMRFSKAFATVENLSAQLEEQNIALAGEMAERNRLEKKIVNISEGERRRISHDLHDGLCQQLTGARLRCAVLERTLPTGSEESTALAQLSTLLEESVNHAYDLSCGLWPVEHDPQSPAPSLEELTRRYAKSSGIAIEFHQKGACPRCTSKHITQLYRIAQEAIANAVKHARPQTITVSLVCQPGETVTLTVRDDGIGRNAAARSSGGLGLGIMAHRARMIGGTLLIDDAVNGGTMVTCIMPCDATPAMPHARTHP